MSRRSVSRFSCGSRPVLTRLWLVVETRRGRPGHLDADGIVEELLGDAPDFRRHGRGEEQGLPGERHQLADALDVGNEAHVEHAVGLVDDEKLDPRHQKPPAFEVIEQAARGGDQHVDAADELGVLVVERHAADQQRDVELMIDAVFDEALLDLGGELAGRLDDERARHAGPRAALFELGEHRQHEGGGLAGAGLGDAEHVAPGEDVRNGLFLDRSRARVAGSGNRRENLIGQAEMGKRHAPS